MAQLITVRLSRHDAQPWGFRLQGGKDFGTPLVVQKVSGGSLADRAGLIPGDAVLKVNDYDVFNLRHKDAQDIVVRSGNCFDMTVQRGGSTWRPSVTPTGNLPTPASQLGSNIYPVTRTSLAHKPQEVRHIGSGYNSSARPFGGINGTDGHLKSIVNKQYNTPVGIYSEEAIAETLSAQAEVLAGGVLGVNFKKNEKIYNAANSEVLKMLHEQENDPEPENSEPYTSTLHHSPNQQQYHSPSAPASDSVIKHVTAPVHRPHAPTTGGLPAGQNICAECERLIVGVFVRIKDKNLHVDCFKCATCGTSLKNQGYFNFNNKLYCDIHAKMAAMQNPPPGTEGYVPLPIKPNQKLSANTISAALNAHTMHSNGTSHLVSSPPSNVHSGYGGPKPFNAGPMSPPSGGPRSPSSYPPPAPNQAPSWSQPKPAPKPAVNPYATLPRTGGGNSIIPIPPPPPLPKQSVYQPKQKPNIPNVKTDDAEKNKIYRPGQATEMLAKSLEKVNISDKEKFKNHAGQILSNMLETRLAATSVNNNSNTVNIKNTYNTNNTNNIDNINNTNNPAAIQIDPGKLQPHAMKSIIDICDKTLAVNTDSTLDSNDNSLHNANGSTLVMTAATVMIGPNHINGKAPDCVDDSGNQNELNPSESVIYRNKPTNQLTTHAVDRRSYIEKDNRRESLQDENGVGNGEDNIQTTTMAEELKDGKQPVCCQCNIRITRGPFITALGRIWCPDHFICVNGNCRRALQDIGFVEEKGDLYCEYCFEKYLAPTCSKCNSKIKGDCLNAIGKHFHPECFTCSYCGKLFGNSPFFLEEGEPYCEADWNELFTTKCFACGFPVEAGDKWVEALNHNYHSQCFNCTMCKKNLEGQSFYNKGGRPFCKNHAR